MSQSRLPTPSHGAHPTAAPLRVGDVTRRVLAALFAVTWLLFPGFGLVDLSVTWDPTSARVARGGLGRVLHRARGCCLRRRRSTPACGWAGRPVVRRRRCVGCGAPLAAEIGVLWLAFLVFAKPRSSDTRHQSTRSRSDDVPARTYRILGNLAFVEGDHAQAVEHFQRAILDAGSQQRPRSEAMANGMLALVRAEQGHTADARRLVTDAISLAERLGEPTILATTYDTAAAALARIGSTTEALTLWEQGLAHLGAAGPILSCVYRSSYALRLDDPHEAARVLGVAIPIAKINSLASIRRSPCSPRPPSQPRRNGTGSPHGFLPRSTTTGQGWRP